MQSSSTVASTKYIYDNIANKVSEILTSLDIETEDEEVASAQKNAKEIFSILKDEINEEYSALSKNAEWDRFTIAFYGETNAGKSTIIETLRLLLKEETKILSCNTFRELQEKNNITQQDFDTLQEEILKLERESERIKNDINMLEKSSSEEIKAKEAEVNLLKEQVDEEQKARNWWQKIVHLFIKSAIDKEYGKKQKIFQGLYRDLNNKKNELNKALNVTQLQHAEVTQKEKDLHDRCKILEEYADGKIIGTGASDFTRINTTYNFSIEKTEFSLIDVPGIEGNEKKVSDSIMEAVQKAHAVFYVTRKAAAPQTGEGVEGTLEKIKKHLGAQTEVWTIFNQNVVNPIRLQRPLVSSDEKDSLNDMHNVLSKQLGEHYCGEIVLSAYPAFLAASNCLLPGSVSVKRKKNFLKQYSAEELLTMSGVDEFIRKIKYEIIGNWKQKILLSNYNKATVTLDKAIIQIEKIKKEKFEPLVLQMEKAIKDAKISIDNGYYGLEGQLDNVEQDVVEDFKKKVREEIYNQIEEDISNDYFKSQLKNIIENKKEILEKELTDGWNQKITDFRIDLEKNIDRTLKNLGILVSNASHNPKLGKFDLDISVGSTLQGKYIIGVVASGIGLALASGGVAIVLAVASLVFNLYKAIRSFISSSYKMEQQRKDADENIRRVANDIKDQIEKSKSIQCKNIDECLVKLKVELDKPLNVVKDINNCLENTKKDLYNLRNSLDKGV
ncbi:hypothetical protein [Anaerovibrio sp. RM50]|uniref:hypothetical protein n=1 Tax=Anaerovibrio sp. RM50 TaxID=1200557 RepID=UPI000487AE7C|nr:hypothetical protein [Anaerovibrio sp. RM50]